MHSLPRSTPWGISEAVLWLWDALGELIIKLHRLAASLVGAD